jgi:hypothetical protein
MIETLLIVLVVFALSVTAYFTIGHWRASQARTRQVPPEVATRRWLRREARTAREPKAGR